MRQLKHNHRDPILKILASKGGIITLRELRRSMEFKVENLERIMGDLEAQGRMVRSIGNQGMENITLRR
jgi:predicted transcriptional regulator of viral defense system